MVYILILIFGSIIGSFLNVCIYRMPRNEGIAFSRSKCPNCKKIIAWYDNIPFLSYIFLRAKCRHCGNKILFRYFAVEAISSVCFLILFMHLGFTYKFWIYSLLSFSLIVITFIDLEFQIIPDRISIGGIFVGIILSILVPGLHDAYTWKLSFINSLSGALIGAGLIYFMGVFGKLVFKKESMGMGDVKLMAMLGAFLGWKMTIFIFFLAPFFGTPTGLYLKFKEKRDIIPYGPYISMASFVMMVWGYKILGYLFL